jgi:ketosteroid isomerase-like protein
MSTPSAEELLRVEEAWGRAMVANDPDAIGRYMADDWTIIGPDGSMSDKPTFLELVRSGALTHDVMDAEDIKVRVYDDTAVLTFRGESEGTWHGKAFRVTERVSDVFVQQEGRWRCVLTHLSRIEPTESE